ncbi:hypothetical protein [Nonomuraea sp. NPDC049709]|uniref:hypothetical protein n=1 Tax=Nonomuraea sp. NPDC049709 TaxID=3154736 RepID=UPI003417076B
MSLARRGVNYDTGTNYLAGGGLSRPVWRHDLVVEEIQAIRHHLRCNAIAIFGTRIDRIEQAAQIALEHGLEVWLQPRLVDGDQPRTLEHLAHAADVAETLRDLSSRVVLNVGCELSIFSTGIVPGASHLERATRLASPRFWPMVPWYNRRLNSFLTEAAAVARSRFTGQLTYSAGLWERVDWKQFDIVGLDYYRLRYNRARYASTLRKFHRHGKPVVITEFGSGSYRGAAHKGPTSHDIIDTSSPTPQLTGTYVRDERVQAGQLDELLGIYEAENVDGAFVFEFIEPYNPHASDPRHDLDMAGYGIVKVLPGDAQHPYRWEPKAAFHTIAARYARDR